jgi:monofunctional glycosyltransferase
VSALRGAIRLLFRYCTKVLWLSVVVGITVLLLFEASVYAQVLWYRNNNPGITRFMEDALAQARKRDPKVTHKQVWTPYERISNNAKLAVIASEDTAFVDHEGFDWKGIEKAFEKNRKKGKVVAGGSTISQQLAKNLFLSNERSYVRKVQEALVTWMLESTLDKERILELYLNVVELGNGVFGVEAAARHHFGTSATQLSREQAARLAAMLPNPRLYDRNRNSPYLARQTAVVLKRMDQVELP